MKLQGRFEYIRLRVASVVIAPCLVTLIIIRSFRGKAAASHLPLLCAVQGRCGCLPSSKVVGSFVNFAKSFIILLRYLWILDCSHSCSFREPSTKHSDFCVCVFYPPLRTKMRRELLLLAFPGGALLGNQYWSHVWAERKGTRHCALSSNLEMGCSFCAAVLSTSQQPAIEAPR